MSSELYLWLKDQYLKSNIKKYHKYFEEWVANLTPIQVLGFEHNMTADYVNHNI